MLGAAGCRSGGHRALSSSGSQMGAMNFSRCDFYAAEHLALPRSIPRCCLCQEFYSQRPCLPDEINPFMCSLAARLLSQLIGAGKVKLWL